MSFLPVLLELQAIHDNLTVIQRDLSSFPPEMAQLDAELKTLVKQVDGLTKDLEQSRGHQAVLSRDLDQAQKLEDLARAALKNSTQKIQYTAAIRELDERERQKTALATPLKDLEAHILRAEKDLAELTTLRDQTKAQFDEFYSIFIKEHENQVLAKDTALVRKQELEAKLEPVELGRFNRLIAGRHGQAIVTVENGTCTGCRTKLRGPLLTQLREKTILNCESCSRLLYFPPKA